MVSLLIFDAVCRISFEIVRDVVKFTFQGKHLTLFCMLGCVVVKCGVCTRRRMCIFTLLQSRNKYLVKYVDQLKIIIGAITSVTSNRKEGTMQMFER